MDLYVAFFTLLLVNTALSSFEKGEFVQTALKAQYAQTRTNWRDLVGHHCPKFGEDDVVAIPLQKPADISRVTDYKIQLAFDGDKFVTPWITVLSKTARNMPHYPKVLATLTRSGGELQKVDVEVVDMYDEEGLSEEFKHEFQNMDSWPKHVVVHYQFRVHNPVDLSRGLYVLYALGLLVTVIMSFTSLWGYRAKLLQLLSDVTAEESSFDSSKPIGAKAD